MRRERRGLVSAGWARGHPHTHTSGLAGIFSSGPRFSSKSSFSKKVIVRFNTAPSPPTLREPAVAATLYIERARLPWAGWPGPLGFWNALERNDIGYRESERPHTRRLVTAYFFVACYIVQRTCTMHTCRRRQGAAKRWLQR